MLGYPLGWGRKGSVLMWLTGVTVCSTLLLLSAMDHGRSQLGYRRFWRASEPSGRYPGRFVPFLVFPATEERMAGVNMLTESLSDQQVLLKVTPRPLYSTQLSYRHSPLPTSSFQLSPEELDWKPWGPKLESVADYFRYLKTPQTRCRKLKRLGGKYLCKAGEGDENNMDNHKYVCMDQPLELMGAKDSQGCLTLSFGTQFDTTFDDAVAELPCEVHMFDVFDYDPQLPKESSHVYFHVEGLADMKESVYYYNLNKTVKMDSLEGHYLKNDLFPRAIHVLKVDIENDEWQAFRDIVKNPLFDAVGQVALEVHATDLVFGHTGKPPPSIPREGWLQALQSRFDVLNMIEKRGFRRVLYWDNIREEAALYDEDGTRYETAGELLYINTNWYNETFKQKLSSYGFKFRGLK